ncbi:hypothetical protein G9F32_03585 [Acinetobacter sp. 194]|uniref:hypothetical protein n=1 Tax=Acinetobacter shaoyimingii TaxID=2715164 RepID=UPI00140C240E|nr:hypothetical protein [Acinetobacter shaoyimingii]NHB57114.1 hypothetical protein [Acinetobacter shaoyimingii]
MKIQKFNLRLVPECYCIVTASKIFDSVLWVDWLDEDGNDVEVNLTDHTMLAGSGEIEVYAIPDSDKDKIDLNNLKELSELDERIQIGVSE